MPTLFVLIPFIGIVLLNLFYTQGVKKLAFGTGILVTLLQMFMACTVIFQIAGNVFSSIEMDYFISFSIDMYAAIVLFTIGLISFISLIIRRHSDNDEIFNFSQLIFIIMIGMNGTVMVNDIFSLYVFLEITSVASFILIAKKKVLMALNGSFKYLLMSSIATVMILTSVAIFFMTFGTLNYNELGAQLSGLTTVSTQIILAVIFLVTGLSIKAGLVPFHMWVPDAYSNSSDSVSVLLAGIVTKGGGVYAIIRLLMVVFPQIAIIQDIFALLGIISIVVGALMAIGQNEFKKMLAYSSISQIGYIIVGACCGTPLGFLGAFLHFFNHATFKSLLFVNSAAVEAQTGHKELDKLQGLGGKMKITAGTSAIAFLSTAGIPPLSGFWSKVIIIVALWQCGYVPYSVIALLASILTLSYFLILQRKVFFGKPTEEFENTKEANKGFITASMILAIIIVLVGIAFPFVLNFLKIKGLF
ncbi:MAG TPA: proton-conducting transporter membrane subunit [Bacteroidales bacterium]|nr:proton-conducting transporter membrane subunit [Bacteroidales bacterium]HPS16856.1 proton-conducting transporter membrane subunit [Bacteroidales bacterium]